MKLHPDAPTPTQIIEQMMTNQEIRPDRVGGGGTDEERAEAHEALLRIVRAGGVRFQCAGCDAPVTAEDAAVCVCGGFICPECRRTEDDGVCDHERPAFLPAEDDDDE